MNPGRLDRKIDALTNKSVTLGVYQEKHIMRSLLFFFLLSFLVSCSSELSETDYREEFVGIYECRKTGNNSSTTFEFNVSIDPDSDDILQVNTFLVPVTEDGEFERGELSPGHFFEMRIGGGEIYIYSYRVIVNGIVMPCEFVGQLKT